jgi:hypothetical protein
MTNEKFRIRNVEISKLCSQFRIHYFNSLKGAYQCGCTCYFGSMGIREWSLSRSIRNRRQWDAQAELSWRWRGAMQVTSTLRSQRDNPDGAALRIPVGEPRRVWVLSRCPSCLDLVGPAGGATALDITKIRYDTLTEERKLDVVLVLCRWRASA